MLRKFLLPICLLVLLSGVFSGSAQSLPGITIADIIRNSVLASPPEFTTLASLLVSADVSVSNLLANPNVQITLFAPTDAAFEELRSTRYGAATFSLVKQDPSLVTQMLQYHVVNGEYTTDSIKSGIADAGAQGYTLPTILGQLLRVTNDTGGGLLIDGESKLIPGGVAVTISGDNTSLTLASPDIVAVNGVIHVVDHVLVPTVDSIGQVITDKVFSPNTNFTYLLQAIAIADPSISQQLFDASSDITFLAPTDAAFEVFSTPVASMLADAQQTSDILAYHILPGHFNSYDIMKKISDGGGTSVINTSLGGLFSRTAVTFTQGDDGGLIANGGAHLVVSDIDAGRGIIHVIDAVLQPPQ